MTSRAKVSRSSQSSRKSKRRAGLPSTGRPVREAALAEVKDDLSRFLRLAESEEILITRHGKPAGVLIGFGSEDDWFDYRLEHHPEFLLLLSGSPPRAGRRAAYILWNVLGLADILFVVVTAARLGVTDPESMAALLRLPLSLLPTFLVPLIIASHMVLGVRLAR